MGDEREGERRCRDDDDEQKNNINTTIKKIINGERGRETLLR